MGSTHVRGRGRARHWIAVEPALFLPEIVRVDDAVTPGVADDLDVLHAGVHKPSWLNMEWHRVPLLSSKALAPSGAVPCSASIRNDKSPLGYDTCLFQACRLSTLCSPCAHTLFSWGAPHVPKLTREGQGPVRSHRPAVSVGTLCRGEGQHPFCCPKPAAQSAPSRVANTNSRSSRGEVVVHQPEQDPARCRGPLHST